MAADANVVIQKPNPLSIPTSVFANASVTLAPVAATVKLGTLVGAVAAFGAKK